MSVPPATPASSPSRRCGMCGACDSMPPWAPERFRLLSSSQRDALLHRMAEKQRLFIDRRDARVVQDAYLTATEHGERLLSNAEEDEEEFVQEASHKVIGDDAAENHACGDPSVLASEILTTRRTIGDMLRHQQPAQSLPTDMTLHVAPLRDTDSDADSFHTAEENDEQALPQHNQVSQTQPHDSKISDLVQSVDFQQLNVSDITSEPYKFPQSIDSTIITKGSSEVHTAALSSSLSQHETRSHATLNTTTLQTDSDHQHLSHLLSENLEDTVSARRQTHTRQRDDKSFLEEYGLPPDLVPLRSEISLQSSPIVCSDCERWRARVQELELKIEALTSALTAREMETSAMRARAAAARSQRVPKTAAQLTEECENLRFTTEFLFHKLEKYEREEANKNDTAR